MVLKLLEDDKADCLVVIDLVNKPAIGDHMIIANGRSSRHVLSMADHVHRMLKSHGINNVSVEGSYSGNWVILDAGDIIIHLFCPEVRNFYKLDELWSIKSTTSETLNTDNISQATNV
ncbi:Iojap-like protein [Candidatus Endolissoclinum faulkneri L2]|uniref:Ribosomal silencing factor RsfS n=1 Tax=Candidatus Endolissoclinum faulkneri L2 TaxID=1193729 RepID=K7YQS9_9PROT|nr:ribosome silencing factor [Candidatus Endolissoclinum faulkneri]AFX98894.1 Iojap-like protein [Candidatus Endolissoclinum faulkneri L2]